MVDPTGVSAAATKLTAANFRLRATSYSSLIDDLDAALPNVSVPTVVADGNRAATPCAPAAANRVAAFCWNSGDNTVPYWIPQGITTSADAYDAGNYEGAVAILVSWYDDGSDGIDRGIRVSFVDWSTPSAPTYRHVLLVEPYTRSDGKVSYRPVNLHAGGIVWYGHLLYVASTHAGFRVFDLRHLWQVSSTDSAAIGLQSDGSYQAYGYKYVLPQAFSYARSTAGGYADLRFSFVGLDRTSAPDSIVVGEYAYPGTGTRLVRFPIDYTDRMLREDADGYVRGTEAYDVSVTSMQGATAINGKFYLSTSDGDTNRGDLATFRPGGAVTMHTDSLPIGPEDLSYWASRDQLWSATEYAGSRSVFAVRASAY
ncbi:hypothetical protein GSF22_24320 [Micromonospora echinofusca]|uniref:Secreted protein n=1 Tax=Micromonospora echinofusca TaxID=47858 RepID=A0ABS3VXE7_MICEH|nr:hypothetical protein [Micromonospora echinofusca]